MFNNTKQKLLSQIFTLESTISTQQATIDQLTTQLATNKSNMALKDSQITQLQSQLSKYSTEVLTELDEQIKLKQSELSSISEQLNQKENEIHLTSLSFFNLEYNSQHYKEELKLNRIKQKEMLISKEYFKIFDRWYVNNSTKMGDKLCSFLINICVNSFNQLSDATMKNVNVANYQSLYNKLTRAYKNYNDNLVNFNIKLNESYLELKLTELELNRNVSMKLDEEKEELAKEREILREQIKIEKELAQEREKLERELVKLRISKLKGEEVDDKIEALEDRLSDNNKVLSNTRFGAVYIISNPSFGKDVVKIGLTRRVFNDCESRLSELNNASVPFLFNPHCILWSDDCFKLESDLHQEFSKYRVNKINMRKEYFKLPLTEIERVIKEKYDPHAIFNYDNIDNNFLASGYKLSDNFTLDKDA